MANVRRLIDFLESAPAGTMVPVDSLRALLEDGNDSATPEAKPERMLTPAEAAEWMHAQIGGRKRTAAAIRKTMRTGFRGIVLQSYPFGRERRTTEADLREFVAKIGAVPRPTAAQQIAGAARSFQVKSDDPADEIAAAQARYRRRPDQPPRTAPNQRRAAGGV